MKNIFSLMIFLSSVLAVSAQGQVVQPKPTALVVSSRGELTDLEIGDQYDGEAPVTVRLYSNAEEVEGYSLTCTWEFFKEGEDEPFLTRHDPDAEIEIRESGVTLIRPTIVYTSRTNSEIFWPFDSEVYEPFRIQLAESGIKVPNAFSPNGDGINDYFNVFDVKSIIEFHGAIYNRWGQQLFVWGLDEMGREGCGWDGTYNGRPVKAGVYYVVVIAKGADGIEYEFRRDVNLLRGYTEGGE
jgi:gliding motility-associated-like protein